LLAGNANLTDFTINCGSLASLNRTRTPLDPDLSDLPKNYRVANRSADHGTRRACDPNLPDTALYETAPEHATSSAGYPDLPNRTIENCSLASYNRSCLTGDPDLPRSTGNFVPTTHRERGRLALNTYLSYTAAKSRSNPFLNSTRDARNSYLTGATIRSRSPASDDRPSLSCDSNLPKPTGKFVSLTRLYRSGSSRDSELTIASTESDTDSDRPLLPDYPNLSYTAKQDSITD
jgi:hypothetical protein